MYIIYMYIVSFFSECHILNLNSHPKFLTFSSEHCIISDFLPPLSPPSPPPQ